MDLKISVNNATPEDRENLRKAFAHFMKLGYVKVTKYAEGDRTTWDIYHTPLTQASPQCAMRALEVSIIYNTVVKEDTTVNTVRTKEPEPALVNETAPKDSSHQQPTQRERKEKGGAQMSLFNPEKNMKENVVIFIEFWNERMWLPKVRGTDRQAREIGAALRRPAFRDNYAEAIAQISRSKFLRGGAGRNFRLTLDWFLQDDNFDKVLEGKYQDVEPPKNITSNKYESEEL